MPPDRRSRRGARRSALCGAELRAADRLRSWRRRRLGPARRRLPRRASRAIRPCRPSGAHRDRRLRRHRHRQGRYTRAADAGRWSAPRYPERRKSAPAGCSSRDAIPAMPATGPMAQVLARDKLLAGNRIAGPAVIEEISATTVLYPGDRAQRACQRRAARGVSPMTIAQARVRSDHARGAAQRAGGHGPGDGRAS